MDRTISTTDFPERTENDGSRGPFDAARIGYVTSVL